MKKIIKINTYKKNELLFFFKYSKIIKEKYLKNQYEDINSLIEQIIEFETEWLYYNEEDSSTGTITFNTVHDNIKNPNITYRTNYINYIKLKNYENIN